MPPQKKKPGAATRAPKAKPANDTRVTIKNVNAPGYTTTVDAVRYQAMQLALLKLLPAQAPGLTQTEMHAALPAQVSSELFPNAGKVGWWAKAVQLDLEAKGLLIREATKPIRWHQRSRR